MAEKQKQYFNDAQLYPLYMSPRDFVGEMGRGTGKGLIDATRLIQVFLSLFQEVPHYHAALAPGALGAMGL